MHHLSEEKLEEYLSPSLNKLKLDKLSIQYLKASLNDSQMD